MYVAILLLSGLSLSAHADPAARYIYLASTQGHFPPYHWYDAENKKPQGYTHKIISLLGEQLGFELQINENNSPLHEVVNLSLQNLISGQSDLAFSPQGAISNNDNVVVVEEPIHTAKTKIFFLKNNKIKYQQWSDLKPHVGGFLIGHMFSGDLDFDRYVKQSLQVKYYSNYKSMVKALLDGEVDYLLGMTRPTWFELQLLGGRGAVDTSDEVVTQLNIHVLISKHSPLALQAKKIDGLLRGYRKNGRMSLLINQAIQEHASYRNLMAQKGKGSAAHPLH